MVDRPAAGEPADQFAAVRLELPDAAFLPGILVFADDDRPFVLPQKQDALSWFCVHGQVFFDRQIVSRIRAIGPDPQQFTDHCSI